MRGRQDRQRKEGTHIERESRTETDRQRKTET